MKLTCDRAELLDAVTLAASVVPARSPRKVLESVLLRASKDGVEVLATDLEVSLRAKVEKADVERAGEARGGQARHRQQSRCRGRRCVPVKRRLAVRRVIREHLLEKLWQRQRRKSRM